MDNQSGLKMSSDFMRLTDKEGQRSFQLASKTYSDPRGKIRVVLLSAIHFAQCEFYKRQGEILSQADAVFYEGKGLDKLGLEWEMQPLIKTFNKCQLYSVIAKAYDLHSQLQAIEYEQNNFIHDDYSFDEEAIDRVGKLSEINECIDYFNVKYKK